MKLDHEEKAAKVSLRAEELLATLEVAEKAWKLEVRGQGGCSGLCSTVLL